MSGDEWCCGWREEEGWERSSKFEISFKAHALFVPGPGSPPMT